MTESTDKSDAVQSEEEPGVGVITLDDVLDIAGAARLRDRFLQALDADGALIVEAGGVEHVDAAGVQLLYAFDHAARMAGRDVAWRSVSAALREAVVVLGLGDELRFSAGGRDA
jgi:phospholipid transport system transporter-binding protein